MHVSCELCELVAQFDRDGAAPIFRNAQLSVIAVDDAAYPGFCRVVWNTHFKEMSDLEAHERCAMMDAVWNVELAVREVMTPDKVNLASLGNMTPHLHWHVIPRFVDDATFPNPVWASVVRATDAHTLKARGALRPQLIAAIQRRMAPPNTEKTR